jgi:Flp pilus assembly protein TadG
MLQVARSSVSRAKSRVQSQRKGNIVVLTAFLLVVILAMIAFAVDVGYMSVVGTEMRASVDAAALAGAGELVNGTAAAEQEALEYLAMNKVGTQTLDASNATIEFGHWNTVTRTFSASNVRPNAIRVTGNNAGNSLFFGRVFGKTGFESEAQAVAVYQPRDIALVLDYSGSMCFDSQFRNLNLLSKSEIENNLKTIYHELGSPTYGTLKFQPETYGNSSTSSSSIKSRFGLTSVPYPYPGGSWDEYFLYVKYDPSIKNAGYQYAYGYMTWINYLQAIRGSHDDTPDLWKTSEQPVTALKDAVDVFLDYLEVNSTDDRVALSLYTYSDQKAILEEELTSEYDLVAKACRERQAGHYTGATNISGGMTKGRIELEDNARIGAKRMMIVMTDGVVNLPTGNLQQDKDLVIAEAEACAEAGIPIVTISLGAYADTDLMQQVADTTGGAHFIIEGGQPISKVKKELEGVFAQVAADRPLQLVK